ncbi:uncharacterized protein LOC6524037 [Drosophila yakuba]|uniref:WH1 domain-containing protein n=1 Tax=Drosophila yakuba TaxID=7245 RepID=B4PYS9_DROYA|nr:uncharacterized protein LOC6524037 [Drosophila yakuba]EDX01015.1 uncharacterized protein Dyak_GE16461 [Drosophila yakuba]
MEIGSDQSYQDFFDKLRGESAPRNLRQIFEDDDRPLANETTSLRYQPGSSKKSQSQAGKRPAMSRSSTLETAAWNTVIAKVVHAYQSSENVGRVGLALSILGEMEASKLIVYRSKSQVLTTLQLTPRGGKVILRESYLQFYDDEQCCWSLRFDKETDQQEFVTFMRKKQLPVEHFPSEVSSSSSSASPSCEDLSKSQVKTTVTKATANPPQPQPRSRVALPTLEKPDDVEPVEEPPPSNEDVIVTPLPRPIGSSNTQRKTSSSSSSSSLAVATSEPLSSDTPLAVTTLDKYLNEQRASGVLMEHKMDAILQAMNRMGGGKSSVPLEKSSDPLLERDSEDEMLELEQKLLNFKRENRALMRNLKAREQALEDLRCSACALCEELLVQNSDLKEQNAQLLASKHISDAGTASPASCRSCEQSSRQIAKMQRQIAALHEALRIFQKSGDSQSGRL